MKRFTFCLAMLVLVFITTSQANAAIVSVSGPDSSAGTAPAIIPPPPHLLDDAVTNTGMQGFDEAQGVLTTVAHAIDGGGVIPIGMLVDSHMIFLNSEGGANLKHYGVVWTFSCPIVGVMSDVGGNLEATSTFELGNTATNYTVTFPGSGPAAPFSNRGMEGSSQDWYTVLSPCTLEVNMYVSEPGDWIRVITSPPPGTATPGYWKNHPEAWPVEEIWIGDILYPKDVAIYVMDLPVKGDKTLTMFPALVAAKLNVMVGNDDSCIVFTIDEADIWMIEHPLGSGVSARDSDWKEWGEPLCDHLDAYNNGLLCAPSRDALE